MHTVVSEVAPEFAHEEREKKEKDARERAERRRGPQAVTGIKVPETD